jgi:predicted nuclease of predicted toxin-antitoxin system
VRFLFDHDVPDDLSYLLLQIGHEVVLLRQVLPPDTPDEAVLRFAHQDRLVLVTCNRDDFLSLAAEHLHSGIIIVIRRRTRVAERAALLRLLERAGETGLVNNINFA